MFNFVLKISGDSSLLKLGGVLTFYSILVYSLAGLRGIIDHFSNVYTYEHVSLITNENFERFPERVKETMENYPVDATDKIIDSTDREKPKSSNAKGKDLKYYY